MTDDHPSPPSSPASSHPSTSHPPAPARPIWAKGDSPTTSPSQADALVRAFMAGRDVAMDRVLLPFDIQASKAHARGLARIGVLDDRECQAICSALDGLMKQVADGSFVLDERYEDGHSAIEAFLTQNIGEAGKRIHTGRSRNDQVLVALRLFMLEALRRIRSTCEEIASTFLERAEQDERTPMPGYTHLQRAVPSTVGLWLGALAEAFIDNVQLIDATIGWIDACPLGTAAGFGVNLDLDRAGVARELGFGRLIVNAMYAQNSRGKFALQVLATLSQCLLDVRRFAWDISLFMTEEFGFVQLPDRYTTGSSIMPNKRNPDTIELLRSGFGVVAGAMAEVQSILSLPSGYQRDVQHTKEPTIRAILHADQMLAIIPGLVKSIMFNKERMRCAMTPAMFATDRAIELATQEGIAFRDAYQQAAAEISSMKELPIEESIARRISYGGSGQPGLAALRERFEELRQV